MKIKLVKAIREGVAASSLDVYIKREMQLPFTPFVGLFVFFDDQDFEANIELIAWNDDTKELECWTEEDKQRVIDFRNNQEAKSMNEIVFGYLELGWNIDER